MQHGLTVPRDLQDVPRGDAANIWLLQQLFFDVVVGLGTGSDGKFVLARAELD